MKRFMMTVAVLMAGTVANAQMGVSPDLYSKVMNNQILMTDAIDIQRARNGIDISQRGNNFGPMSAAGLAVLNGEGQRVMPMVPAINVRGKAALARERAARRRLADEVAKQIIADRAKAKD